MTEIIDHTYRVKINIIYAEDEWWFREPMVEMLIACGFDVIRAFSDGRKLLDFAKRVHVCPDLYLTDLHMLNMNGIELTKEILMKWPS